MDFAAQRARQAVTAGTSSLIQTGILPLSRTQEMQNRHGIIAKGAGNMLGHIIIPSTFW
jgi:hypothetical protein